MIERKGLSRLFITSFILIALWVVGGILMSGLQFETFMSPHWLWGCLGVPMLGWLLHRSFKKQKQAHETYAEWSLLAKMAPPQLPLVGGLRALLCGLAFILMVMALARPQGSPVMTDQEGQGIDIMIAIDISNSTRTEDVIPNRLEAEKTIVVDLLRQLSFDRVGLMVFSSEAFPLAPFTTDYEALETLMPEIDHSLLGGGGTDFTQMLSMAQERFKAVGSTGKLLIVLSDGENHNDSRLAEEIKLLQQADIKLITVGVGTTKGGKVPSHTDFWGNVVYKSYQGDEIISKLDEASLKQLAAQGGGYYISAAQSHLLIPEIKQLRNKMVKRHYKLSNSLTYEEKFQAYLLLAAFLLLLERLLVLQGNRSQHMLLRRWHDLLSRYERLTAVLLKRSSMIQSKTRRS